MTKILKREETIVELSENENEDDDDDDDDDSSDSSLSINNADEFEPNISTRDPYDFESDDEHELNANSTAKFDDSSIDDNYRIPPLRIVLARTILTTNER